MRSRPVWLLLVPALLLAVTLRSGRAEPATPWRLEARVPAGTLVFASAEDVGTWGKRLEKTGIGKFFGDPEVSAFLRPFTAWLDESVKAPAQDGPFAKIPPFVFDLVNQLTDLSGQGSAAFLGMDPETKSPRIVLSLDFGAHADDFIAFVGRLKEQLDPKGDTIVASQKDGRTRWTMDADGMPIAATTSDTTFVAATGEALLDEVLRGQPASPLSGSEAFLSVRRKVTGDSAAALVYADVPGLLSAFARDIKPRARRAFDALGLDTVKAAGYGISFAGEGFSDVLTVHAPNADHGLASLFRASPLERPRFLSLAPKGTILYTEANVLPSALLDGIRTMLRGVDERTAGKLEEALSKWSTQVGLDLEKEVVGGLAEGFGVHAGIPATGGIYPEVAIMVRAKDPAAFERVLDRLATGITGAVNEDGNLVLAPRSIAYHGKTIHYVDIQKARGKGIFPFTPSWTVLGDTVVFALVPHALKEIVLRSESKGEPGLADQEDFRAVMQQKPADAASIAYVDLQGILGFVYDTGVPLLQTIAKGNVQRGIGLPFTLDPALLPAARTVRPFFRSVGAYTSTTTEGITAAYHGPVPVLPTLVAIGAFAAVLTGARRSMSAPMMATAVPDHEMGQDLDRELATVQIEDLVGKVEMYVLEKKSLPPDLKQLVEAKMLDGVPNDPWGLAFRLRVLDGAAKTFVVESAGADGRFGTPDDLSNAK